MPPHELLPVGHKECCDFSRAVSSPAGPPPMFATVCSVQCKASALYHDHLLGQGGSGSAILFNGRLQYAL